jgi:hypothetical protein
MENQENSFPELGNESTDALPENPAERRRSCGNPGVAIPRESERGSALIAESANELWRETRTRARLTPNTIQKNW